MPWGCRGSAMGPPWVRHGCPIGMLWVRHVYATGVPWAYDGCVPFVRYGCANDVQCMCDAWATCAMPCVCDVCHGRSTGMPWVCHLSAMGMRPIEMPWIRSVCVMEVRFPRCGFATRRMYYVCAACVRRMCYVQTMGAQDHALGMPWVCSRYVMGPPRGTPWMCHTCAMPCMCRGCAMRTLCMGICRLCFRHASATGPPQICCGSADGSPNPLRSCHGCAKNVLRVSGGSVMGVPRVRHGCALGGTVGPLWVRRGSAMTMLLSCSV